MLWWFNCCHVQLLWPHGLTPPGFLCSWDFPGKNIGVGCHFLLQRIFLTQELNSGLLHCRQILYWLSCELYSLAWYIPIILTFGGLELPGEFENTKSRLIPASVSLGPLCLTSIPGDSNTEFGNLCTIASWLLRLIWYEWGWQRSEGMYLLRQLLQHLRERERGSSDHQDWETG